MNSLMTVLLTVVSVIVVVKSDKYTDWENASLRLPKLFVLDSYDRCFNQKNGVFCLGKFQIYSDVNPNPLYDQIQAHSHGEANYNRTFLHRGYCLNTRCRIIGDNLTASFERCVDDWARTLSLRTRLRTLHYCRQAEDKTHVAIDTPRRLFLYVIGFILLMNAVGTLYDLKTRSNEKKENGNRNSLLLAWSIPANWKRFAEIPKYTDPKLRAFQAMDANRVAIPFLIVGLHANLVLNKFYQFEAGENEKFQRSYFSRVFQASTTNGQVYVLLLTFFSTFFMMKKSEKQEWKLVSLPKLILKKIFRIWPLNAFAIAYAATWWDNAGDGPLWPILITSESNVCRRKFWSQIFFIQNYFQPEECCSLPTWVLAVEVQLYVVCSMLIVILMKYRKFNLRTLTKIYMIAVLLTFLVTYSFGFKSVVQTTTGEALLAQLRDVPTHVYFYIQPISCLINAIAGIILGYIYYYVKIYKERTRFQIWSFLLSDLWLPIAFVWSSTHILITALEAPLATSLFMVVDRVAVSLIFSFGIFFSLQRHLHNKVNKFLTWNGWSYVNRLGYPIAVVHWQINLLLVAQRRTMIEAQLLTTVMYTLITWILAAIVALPITILIDSPAQQLFDKLLYMLP